jgi:hypothetical protein
VGLTRTEDEAEGHHCAEKSEDDQDEDQNWDVAV